MDLNKYEINGWTLNRQQFTDLLTVITNHPKKELRVVEFGSGKSTEFLVDVHLQNIKNLDITTFDDNPDFSYKNKENYDFIDLKIRPLRECDDLSYQKMFSEKRLISESFKDKTSPLTTRQKNNFYNIQDGDLTGIYDLMILDGPNGNGRNISYLYVKNNLAEGSIVLIDDYNHYDFVEKFSLFFEHELLIKHEGSSGKRYVILKVLKCKL